MRCAPTKASSTPIWACRMMPEQMGEAAIGARAKCFPSPFEGEVGNAKCCREGGDADAVPLARHHRGTREYSQRGAADPPPHPSPSRGEGVVVAVPQRRNRSPC